MYFIKFLNTIACQWRFHCATIKPETRSAKDRRNTACKKIVILRITRIICEMKEGWYAQMQGAAAACQRRKGVVLQASSFKSDGDNCGNSLVRVLVNDIFIVLEDPILTGLPNVFLKNSGGIIGI